MNQNIIIQACSVYISENLNLASIFFKDLLFLILCMLESVWAHEHQYLRKRGIGPLELEPRQL